MRRGDGRESYPAVEFPRGTKGMVMVFSPRGEALSVSLRSGIRFSECGYEQRRRPLSSPQTPFALCGRRLERQACVRRGALRTEELVTEQSVGERGQEIQG